MWTIWSAAAWGAWPNINVVYDPDADEVVRQVTFDVDDSGGTEAWFLLDIWDDANARTDLKGVTYDGSTFLDPPDTIDNRSVVRTRSGALSRRTCHGGEGNVRYFSYAGQG